MRHVVLGMLCLAAVIAYVQRLGLYTAVAEVSASLGMDAAQMGQVMSAWSLGYAILQLPAGWLGDVFGSRRVLALFAILWSVLTGAASRAEDEQTLLTVWFCMGLAQAGLVPCAAKLIGRWFPESSRASASGLLVTAMAAGIALAPMMTGRLLRTLDWQTLYAIYMVPGLVWAILFFFVVRDVPVGETPATVPAPIAFGKLLRSGSVWYLCGQQFFRAFAMAFFMTWFPTYLRSTRGVDLTTSGDLTGLAGVGGMLGGLAGGFASDWLLRVTGNRRLSRQGLAVTGLSTCAVLLVVAHFTESLRMAVALQTCGAFIATFGGVSGYTVAIDIGGRGVATLFGLMNMCGNLGHTLFPYTAGKIVASATLEGREAEGWTIVLYLCAAIFIVDAICWALLNPKQNLDGEPL